MVAAVVVVVVVDDDDDDDDDDADGVCNLPPPLLHHRAPLRWGTRRRDTAAASAASPPVDCLADQRSFSRTNPVMTMVVVFVDVVGVQWWHEDAGNIDDIDIVVVVVVAAAAAIACAAEQEDDEEYVRHGHRHHRHRRHSHRHHSFLVVIPFRETMMITRVCVIYLGICSSSKLLSFLDATIRDSYEDDTKPCMPCQGVTLSLYRRRNDVDEWDNLLW